MRDNIEDYLDTPRKFDPKIPLYVDHPNTLYQKHESANSIPDEQNFNIKIEGVAFKSKVIEQKNS